MDVPSSPGLEWVFARGLSEMKTEVMTHFLFHAHQRTIPIWTFTTADRFGTVFGTYSKLLALCRRCPIYIVVHKRGMKAVEIDDRNASIAAVPPDGIQSLYRFPAS